MFSSGGTATTATGAGGTTQTSPSASAQAASPSAHGKLPHGDHHGRTGRWSHNHAQRAPLRLSGARQEIIIVRAWATVNYPEPPPPWRSRGSGYDGQTNERQRNAKPPVVKFAGIKAE